MSDKNNKTMQRRQLLKGALGASAIVASVPSQWSTPIVNGIVTPVHAQTSPPPPPPPPPPPEVCPLAVTSTPVSGPVSGQGQCTITFDVLSSDPAQPLTISSITDNAVDPATVTYEAFGEVTDTVGSRVVWQGPTVGGELDCSEPVTDVTFTITASCAANTSPFTQTITLAVVLA